MIIDLFKLFRSYRRGEGKEGLTDFANDQAGDLLLAPFWIAILIIAPFLIISAIFAFFKLWGGPYGLAKFFFWLLTIVLVLVVWIMRSIISRSKKMIKKVSNKIIS